MIPIIYYKLYCGIFILLQLANDGGHTQVDAAFGRDPRLAMRLPPASPFDNFLKAAGCQITLHLFNLCTPLMLGIIPDMDFQEVGTLLGLTKL